MKKILLLLTLSLFVSNIYGQAKTANIQFYKVKTGHRSAFNEALKNHTAKFRKAGDPSAWTISNVTGGSHHNEVMATYNFGLSWAERDALNGPTASSEAASDFYLKVSPHLEGITAGDIISYRAEYSNSAMKESTDKFRFNVLTIKYAPSQEFWDVIKRLPKVWDKLGFKIATYTTSGANRLIFSRRLPSGWKELDEASKLKEIFDEVYGKGTYEKDMAIMRAFVVENDIMYMTVQNDLSSK
ncbi:MAG: hypothetical protein RLZZ96_1167 [Bacteroidota bacterium]|jgi:hypothetical protein